MQNDFCHLISIFIVQGPFTYYGLTFIPAWITGHMFSKLWDDNTPHPFINVPIRNWVALGALIDSLTNESSTLLNISWWHQAVARTDADLWSLKLCGILLGTI